MAEQPRNTKDNADSASARQTDEQAERTHATKPGVATNDATAAAKPAESRPKEHGGPAGLEPTRYGDWEKNGRCTDF